MSVALITFLRRRSPMLSSEESGPFFPAWASPVLPPSLPLLLASKPVTVRNGSDDRCGAPLHESPSRDPPSFFAACPIGSPGPSNKLSHTSAAGKGGGRNASETFGWVTKSRCVRVQVGGDLRNATGATHLRRSSRTRRSLALSLASLAEEGTKYCTALRRHWSWGARGEGHRVGQQKEIER